MCFWKRTPGLARCPFLSHERAAREGDECHKTLKTKGIYEHMSVIICIYKYIHLIYLVYTTWYIHGIYWCKMKTHGAAGYYFCVCICMLYIYYIHNIYLVNTWYIHDILNYISGICSPNIHGWYIRSKTFLDLFSTFLIMIFLWYLQDIKGICMVYQTYIKRISNVYHNKTATDPI